MFAVLFFSLDRNMDRNWKLCQIELLIKLAWNEHSSLIIARSTTVIYSVGNIGEKVIFIFLE